MLVKIVVIFLAVIIVLAMFGRVRYPGQARLKAMKCVKCGRHKIGKTPCSCTRKG